MTSSRASLLTPVLVLLAACSSGGGGGAVLPGAAANVNGAWFGSWSEQTATNPLTGTVRFDLVQDANGSVSGTVTFTGAGCMTSSPFSGGVNGDLLTGSAAEGTSRVEFVIGAEDWDDPGSEDIGGIFNFTQGSGCPAIQAGFIAPRLAPLVLEEPELEPALLPERVGTALILTDERLELRPVVELRTE